METPARRGRVAPPTNRRLVDFQPSRQGLSRPGTMTLPCLIRQEKRCASLSRLYLKAHPTPPFRKPHPGPDAAWPLCASLSGGLAASVALGSARLDFEATPVVVWSMPITACTTQQPTRPPVRVSGSSVSEEANLGIVSCWIRRRSRATSCQEWAMGSVGSSAERRRPLPGPVLLCQPCRGHPS